MYAGKYRADFSFYGNDNTLPICSYIFAGVSLFVVGSPWENAYTTDLHDTHTHTPPISMKYTFHCMTYFLLVHRGLQRNLQISAWHLDCMFSMFTTGHCLCSPGFLSNLVRKPPQNWEKAAKIPGGQKLQNIQPCLSL